MAVCKIFALYFFSILNSSCHCYEGISNRKDIYVLYEQDNAYRLNYFSNFHEEYTAFAYDLKLSVKDTVITFSAAGGFSTSLVRENKHFSVMEKFPSTHDEIIELKEKNCNRLKISKIPKERILKNSYPN